MNVSAIIVTRGDVDLKPVLRSLPEEWEVLVWNNGIGTISRRVLTETLARIVTGRGELPDLAVYGRYAAIEYASNDLIYVQDDDCVVSDPTAIVDAWIEQNPVVAIGNPDDYPPPWEGVVCNMPANFRARHFYDEHSLVGFGACFHRDAPFRAFEKFALGAWGVQAPVVDGESIHYVWEYGDVVNSHPDDRGLFNRTCDIVFTTLTPRVLVDVLYEDLPWASADNRMWKQPTHQEERQRMLDLVLKVRDS